MQGISKYNNGFKYILTQIDIFSKYAWAIPLKNKGSIEMTRAFQNLFEISSPGKPEKFKQMLEKNF